MRSQTVGIIGVAPQIVPIGMTIAKRDVHNRAGQRRIRTRAHRQVDISRFCGSSAIGVNYNDFSAAPFSCASNVGHHIDLGRNRVAAPNHNQIAVVNLPGIDTTFDPGSGKPTGISQCNADGAPLPRITHRMTQAIDAIAVQMPHRPGVKIWPDRFGTVSCTRLPQALGDSVEGLVPADRDECVAPNALVAHAQQRFSQPVRMILPLGIARHLRTDDTGCV